jgi:hypothetical protein
MADEALRRADELLSDLIELVETARALPMSVSCVLPRERLLDLLDEMREVLPPEMEEARTVLATRDRILKDAYERAEQTRLRAVGHRAEQITTAAEHDATETVAAAQAEHGRLVAATTVHQAAAQAAAALRTDAEKYQAQLSADAQLYDAKVRGEADRYAADARSDAQRYATKLTADADDYAERTLQELSAVLHKAVGTVDQGRSSLAVRRAGEWVADAGPAQRGGPESLSA